METLNAQKDKMPTDPEYRVGGAWGFHVVLKAAAEGSGLGALPPFRILTVASPPPPTENGAFFCNECDCRFSEEASLKRHTLQTHSDKPYKCDRCQASFRYKGNLASHKTVHTGMALLRPATAGQGSCRWNGGRTLEKSAWSLDPRWAEAGSKPCSDLEVGLTLLCLASQPNHSLGSLSFLGDALSCFSTIAGAEVLILAHMGSSKNQEGEADWVFVTSEEN